MSRDDDFLSRWSNRKRAVREEEAQQKPTPEEASETLEEPAEVEVKDTETEEEILARFNLPSPESLGPGDDFSGFMQSGVPEYLRRRALRRLWRSNPVLANLDGLNDYDEDFTSPEETMKVLKTAYKVGRGFLKDPEEEEESSIATDEGAGGDGETGESVAGEVESLKESAQADAAPEMDDQVDTAEVSPLDKSGENLGNSERDSAPRPRRMRFET